MCARNNVQKNMTKTRRMMQNKIQNGKETNQLSIRKEESRKYTKAMLITIKEK